MGIFSFVLGAVSMLVANTYIINPRIFNTLADQQVCGPPAPSTINGTVDYNEIIRELRGDKIVIHGPVLICFLDSNSVSHPDTSNRRSGIVNPPGGGLARTDSPPTL